MYCGIIHDGTNTETNQTKVIPYDEMQNINHISKEIPCHMWLVEQTKEARFMPSLSQENIQIGIIFNYDLINKSSLLECDILNPENITDADVKSFVNENYYQKFIKDRKHKDDFFTDRESAILFGIPSNLIEGILVGRIYEKDSSILNEIKKLLPNCYICNLDGKVIYI